MVGTDIHVTRRYAFLSFHHRFAPHSSYSALNKGVDPSFKNSIVRPTESLVYGSDSKSGFKTAVTQLVEKFLLGTPDMRASYRDS